MYLEEGMRILWEGDLVWGGVMAVWGVLGRRLTSTTAW